MGRRLRFTSTRLVALATMVSFVIAAWIGTTGTTQSQQANSDVLFSELTPGVVKVNRLSRHFYLYRPAKLVEPAPLLLVLHGGGPSSEALGISRRLEFRALADRDGFVIAYPNGITNNWNDGRNSEKARQRAIHNIDDVGFIDQLIRSLVAEGVVRAGQVYATGLSNGGMMTFRLACELSEQIAAAAPIIANMPQDLLPICQPRRAIPLLVMNGTEDSLVPWQGGPVAPHFPPDRGSVLSTMDSLQFWQKANGCNPHTSEPLPDRDPNDGTRVSLHRWQGCANGGELQLYEINGGGHTMPGWQIPQGSPWARILGRASQDIDAEQRIWDFLKRYKLPQPPG